MISLDVLVGYKVHHFVEAEPKQIRLSGKTMSLGNSTNDILKHERLNRGIYRTIAGLLLVKTALGGVTARTRGPVDLGL